MALDIVTSYQGFDHITADQLADFQRGLLGDSCILPVGSKMEVNIQTANQITVADGVVVYDGREIHIPYGTSENVSITSGTQGMMRNDIVCLQYNRDESSGVESVEFVTIAGTPVASDPQDPAYSNLDIRTGVFMSQKPFCRVRLNGTAIEAIDMLVEVYDKGIYQLNNDFPYICSGSGTINSVSNSYKYVFQSFGVTFAEPPAVICTLSGASANRFINVQTINKDNVRIQGYCTQGTADIEFLWVAIGKL